MELIIYLLVVAIVSVGSFWVAGTIYGLVHTPSLYFPVLLATKMAACAVFGTLLFLLGGLVLSTLVFNAEMGKRQDYQKWPVIFAGLLISLLCSVVIYIAAIGLAWQILG
ncbi:MAG: hypothetical protein AAGF35_11070 [Pseudomonadota bacterium]